LPLPPQTSPLQQSLPAPHVAAMDLHAVMAVHVEVAALQRAVGDAPEPPQQSSLVRHWVALATGMHAALTQYPFELPAPSSCPGR
jgi:hypothetical protein